MDHQRKTLRLGVACILISIAGFAPKASAAESYYFIGHSYFSSGAPIPTVFSNLCNAAGKSIYVDRRIVGGSTLSQHWNEAVAPAAISNSTYDYVVMIDGSRTAFTAPPANNPINFTNYSAQFDALISSRGGQSVLFSHWAGAASILEEGLSTSQTNVNAMYFNQAANLGCLASPVGNSWRRALEQDPVLKTASVDQQTYDGLYLYGDTSHGGSRGAYLAACAVYATVYNETPEGIDSYFIKGVLPVYDLTLSTNQARFFQRIAWDAWRNYQAISPPVAVVAASTNLVGVDQSITLVCTASDDGSITNYVWDFGDGTAVSSGVSLTNVTHAYSVAGFYDAYVTVYDDSGEVERAGQVIYVDGTALALSGAVATNALRATVQFSEAVEVVSAQTVSNYTLSGGLTITGAVRSVSGDAVNLYLASPMIDGNSYTVTVSQVEDLYGNPISAGSTAVFTFVNSETNRYTKWLFDFGSAASTTPGAWNNVTSGTVGLKVQNAVDTNGIVTPLDLTILDDFEEVDIGGYSTNAFYPDEAGQDSLAVIGGHFAAELGNNTQAVLRVEGLDVSRIYDFTFFGSHTGLYHTTHFIIGSNEQTLVAGYNQANRSVIDGVSPDANGSIQIQMCSDTFSDYGNLNVMEISTAELDPQFIPPFSETFEDAVDMAGQPGVLDGQNGWSGGGFNEAQVQSVVTHGGAQACMITNGLVHHRFDDRNTNVWVRMQVRGVHAATNGPVQAGASAVFWVNESGNVVVFSNTTPIVLSAQVAEGEWVEYLAHVDYESQQWSLSVNGTNVAENLGFYETKSSFDGLSVVQWSGTAYLDDVDVLLSEPSVPDTDGDGLPDWWETMYFGGATNALPDAVASNGINTLAECYVAGIDPTNAASIFQLSDLQAESFGSVLKWQGVSGRVYTVYWSSNLLDGFQLLQSNVPWSAGAFTDATHSAESSGFYKINVNLE